MGVCRWGGDVDVGIDMECEDRDVGGGCSMGV